jgi:hypothetical protein
MMPSRAGAGIDTVPVTIKQTLSPFWMLSFPDSLPSTCSSSTARTGDRGRSRSVRLERLIAKTPTGIHLEGDGAAIFAHACKLGAEGIVSKHREHPYRSGPSKAWLKVKKSGGARRPAVQGRTVAMPSDGTMGCLGGLLVWCWTVAGFDIDGLPSVIRHCVRATAESPGIPRVRSKCWGSFGSCFRASP